MNQEKPWGKPGRKPGSGKKSISPDKLKGILKRKPGSGTDSLKKSIFNEDNIHKIDPIRKGRTDGKRKKNDRLITLEKKSEKDIEMDEVLESLIDEQKKSTAKKSDEMAFSNTKTDDERYVPNFDPK